MSAALSFEQAPPLSVPHRFFLTGPLFGVAAGVLVALRGDEVVLSRWSMATFAAVHLVTVGFMLQVMCGALMQFLPVAAGANVWRPRLVAGVVHPSLTLGAVALTAGFLGAGADAMRAAVVLLGAGLTAFVAVTGLGLARSPAIGPTLLLLRSAVAALAVTAGLGVALAAIFAWGAALPLVQLVHLHAAWGLGGWALLLVIAVALLVVPMFQLTPPYPVRFSRGLGLAVAGALAAWTVGVVLDVAALDVVATSFGVGALGAFAVKTLHLQSKRRRKVLDTTVFAWRVGLGCLLVAGAALVALRLPLPALARARLEYLLGVALVAGAFPAMMAGMLYKIVGFIEWLHLQRVMAVPPTMQKVLPDARARWQWRVFTGAVLLLVGGALWPPLARLGGLGFAAACVILELHLISATRLYLRLSAAAALETPATP
ncbi:MAG: hypothetical protein IAE78_31435 [Myxococcus sp.]|nr:hypothetical protein [Myxococcus sp.]